MPLSVVSLYTGIGGLDFGFEAAGYKTAVALELDATACRMVRLNRSWPLIEGDIHEVTSEEILDTAGLEVGEADVLIGGPPCQPFSKSSYWVKGDSGRLSDNRSNTLGAYLRVLRDVQPRAFLLENVPGLAYSRKDEGLRLLLDGIDAVNREVGTAYSPSVSQLSAADFGVPQARQRVFIVGSRDGTHFQFPSATHTKGDDGPLLDSLLEPYRTAWDAIGDLPPDPDEPGLSIGGRWRDLIPSIPEGHNYLWHTPRGGGKPLFGWRTRYWSFLLKLAKNLPSWTIQANPGASIGPFHWRNRKLSSAELCRLQTIPDGLRFDCGRTQIQKMLGNAVPSLLAEVLATAIRGQLLGSRRRGRRLKLMPPVRSPMPGPERRRPVPKRYLELIGEHAEHPGTGKGPAAVRRAASR